MTDVDATRPLACDKPAVVEADVCIHESLLGNGGNDHPVYDNGGKVGKARLVRTGTFAGGDGANDHRSARTDAAGKVCGCHLGGCDEAPVEQDVAGVTAGEDHLRQYDELGAEVASLTDGCQATLDIPFEVADH